MRLHRSGVGVELTALIALVSCVEAGEDKPSGPSLACAGSQSSTWQKPISSRRGSVARYPGGGLAALSGESASSLTKLDDFGVSVWTATVEGSAASVSVVPGGDTLAMTLVPGTESVDPEVRSGGRPRLQANVTRWDADGKRLWQSAILDGAGDLIGSFISAGLDGDVVVGGTFVPDLPPSAFPNPPFIEGGFVARLSPSGQMLWERHFLDPGAVRGFVQDLGGRTGVTFALQEEAVIDDLMLKPKGISRSGFLVWFDSTGRAVEAFDITEDPEQGFSAVVRDDEGRFYVTGYVAHDGPSYTSEFFVSAFDATGGRLWARRFNPGRQADDSRLAIDECGDVLLVGNGLDTSPGILAARIASNGEEKAQLVLPVAVADYLGAVAPAPGGIFFMGSRDNQQTSVIARLAL